jgi:hypothetical protein
MLNLAKCISDRAAAPQLFIFLLMFVRYNFALQQFDVDGVFVADSSVGCHSNSRLFLRHEGRTNRRRNIVLLFTNQSLV